MNETSFLSTLQTGNQAFWGFFDWWGILILFAGIVLLLYFFRGFYLTRSLFLDLLDFGFGWVTYAFYLLGLQEHPTAFLVFHTMNILVAVYIWYSSRTRLHWIAQILVFLKGVYISPNPWFPTNVFPLVTFFGFTWNTARKEKKKEKEAKKRLREIEQEKGKDSDLEETEVGMEKEAKKEAFGKAAQQRVILEQQINYRETAEEVKELLREAEEKLNRIGTAPEAESLMYEQLSTTFAEAEERAPHDPAYAIQILLALQNELNELIERLDKLLEDEEQQKE